MGYVLHSNGLQSYHSGDCMPYPALAETLQKLEVGVTLLPVNGRNDYRLQRGVPGNFHPHEAVRLASIIGADWWGITSACSASTR